jgi:hypothetical protein
MVTEHIFFGKIFSFFNFGHLFLSIFQNPKYFWGKNWKFRNFLVEGQNFFKLFINNIYLYIIMSLIYLKYLNTVIVIIYNEIHNKYNKKNTTKRNT